mmetsp:Transcript_1292/g.4111  ORF Transcript_1292/g.4111 Transcript_1292/m.4111 type:complete len:248 (-) Transcript_1292:207-950(-)
MLSLAQRSWTTSAAASMSSTRTVTAPPSTSRARRWPPRRETRSRRWGAPGAWSTSGQKDSSTHDLSAAARSGIRKVTCDEGRGPPGAAGAYDANLGSCLESSNTWKAAPPRPPTMARTRSSTPTSFLSRRGTRTDRVLPASWTAKDSPSKIWSAKTQTARTRASGELASTTRCTQPSAALCSRRVVTVVFVGMSPASLVPAEAAALFSTMLRSSLSTAALRSVSCCSWSSSRLLSIRLPACSESAGR